MAAGAFRKQGVLAQKLHAALKICSGLAITAHAHVAGGDTAHMAIVVVEHFGRSESGEDLHAQLFGLLSKPACEVRQAHHIVAVVVKTGRQHPLRKGGGTAL